uniref:NADH-ubiquinone oxidoreductase chain 2 n=1 Tax=Dolichovespula panda TaxID=2040468 RepID=A0A291C4Z2_9HYME|nr:NADH dehydrogenase subunit 2 [Dolichovespula panda]ATF28539.1 NADH dehydrogenase subunit 2 [Dolichovespula panda]
MNKFNNYLNSSNILFYSMFLIMLILSIISISLSNFMHLWLLMEINTLIFISMMALETKNFKLTFNFFLIQSISSLMLIYLMNLKHSLFNNSEWINFILILSLSMKIGLFPFFYWPPLINKNISWKMIFIMSTTQKFIPLLLIYSYFNNIENKFTNFLFIMLSIFSSLMSIIMCLNENNIKKIMSYSSLNHLSWMIFIMIFDLSMFMIYFIFYFISMMFMCLLLNKLDIKTFQDLSKFQYFNYKEINFYLSLNLLIISALPPFMTFLIKLNSIKILIEGMSLLSSLLLTMISILTLIFYMNMIMKFNIFFLIKSKFYHTYKLNFKFNFFSLILTSFMTLSFFFLMFKFLN